MYCGKQPAQLVACACAREASVGSRPRESRRTRDFGLILISHWAPKTAPFCLRRWGRAAAAGRWSLHFALTATLLFWPNLRPILAIFAAANGEDFGEETEGSRSH